jgi:hypothetical protein
MTLSKEKLHALFEYRDGKLYWRELAPGRRRSLLAGSVGTNRYVNVFVERKQIYAHRIIYMMFTGDSPETIDHINGDRSDNRIENLRACSQSDNNKNMSKSSRNKSGVKNVSWYMPYKKWRVALRVDGKQRCIGYYEDIEAASLAAKEARDRYRGEFANHG